MKRHARHHVTLKWRHETVITGAVAGALALEFWDVKFT